MKGARNASPPQRFPMGKEKEELQKCNALFLFIRFVGPKKKQTCNCCFLRAPQTFMALSGQEFRKINCEIEGKSQMFF